MRDTIIFDIDGTLSILGNRYRHIHKEPKSWDAFYDECDQDEPNKPVMAILYMLANLATKPNILFVTGRPERVREKTQQWFLRHRMLVEDDRLLMRKDGDYRPDYVIKEELIQPFIGRIDMVFEDRKQVVDMYRRLGITVFQVADGDF